jgi:hypothetical protein
MLNALRYDEQLTRTDTHITSGSRITMHPARTRKEVIGVIVLVPDELTLHLHDPEIVPVELPDRSGCQYSVKVASFSARLTLFMESRAARVGATGFRRCEALGRFGDRFRPHDLSIFGAPACRASESAFEPLRSPAPRHVLNAASLTFEGLLKPLELAHELKRGGLNFFLRRGRLEVEQRLDVPAHGRLQARD